MAFEIVSGQKPSERDLFLLEMANVLTELNAEKIGVFAVLPGGETFQGYHRMDFGDKLLMSGHAQMDAVDVMIRNNMGRYLEADEEEMEYE